MNLLNALQAPVLPQRCAVCKMQDGTPTYHADQRKVVWHHPRRAVPCAWVMTPHEYEMNAVSSMTGIPVEDLGGLPKEGIEG